MHEMLEILGKHYVIDLNGIVETCKTGEQIEDEHGHKTHEINIFKYELLKVCVERLLNEYEQTDEKLGALGSDSLSISFKFAFNTLLKNGIIIEEDNIYEN